MSSDEMGTQISPTVTTEKSFCVLNNYNFFVIIIKLIMTILL